MSVTQKIVLEEIEDEELIARCKEELPYRLDAYREVLRRYEQHVYNTAHKIIGSRPDAEEVCQDSFLQVYHKINQFEGRSSFKTWLFRIVYNFSIRRRETIVKRAQRERDVGEEIAFLRTQADDVDMSAFGEDMQEILKKLPEDQREVLVLRFVSGLSLNEIADVLNVGLSAAKMRLYRALQEFKLKYGNTRNPHDGRD